MELVFLAQQVVNGLVLGGYYLLIALGLSLIFSVGGVVNLAHGAFYTLGAYVSVEIGRRLGFGPAAVLSPVIVGLLGVVFERFILRRFYTEDPILGLLVTFGLAMAAEQVIRMIWGAAPLLVSLPQALKGSVIVGDFLFSRYRLLLLAIVAVILGLEGIEDIKGGDLSYGGQRLVDLGITLASKPQILLLDEPLAGLAAAERERVSNLVRTVSAHTPVLIVEHDIDRVLGFSQVVTVMNQGEVLMTGAPEAVRCDRRVQEVYTGTGTPHVTGRANGKAADAAAILQLAKINAFYGKSHILNDASLDVRKGEIVALLGRNGAGKSTLLKTIAGLVPAASGSIIFEGQDMAGLPAPDVARRGIGYVPQGRGLFAGMSVAENLHLGRLARSTRDGEGVVWSEQQILEMFPVLKSRLTTPADYLSGGEQQMLAVARALSGNVRLLLLDEPFEGLAPTVVEELFTVFDKLRQRVPILIVEHNLDLVLALADRVFALERGAVFHEGPADALLKDLDYRKQILWL